MGLDEGAGFAGEGGGIRGISADLDEVSLAVWVGGVEIDFVSLGGAGVVDLAAAAEEFDENGGFEGMAGIGASGAFVNGDEAGIDGIGFAGVDHALAFRGSEKRGGADEKSVLEVGEKGVEAVF